MQRPENYALLGMLIFAGGVVMLAVAIACHICGRRVIRHSRYLALRVCVPALLILLVIGLFAIIPASLADFYQSSYGYQLQPGEASGPMGETGGLIVVLLWPFGFLLLFIYVLVFFVYGAFRFFRWIGEGIPNPSNFDN
jgi:hypothetical protein